MTRLDNVGRSYSVVTEIVRLGESFIFVPTCGIFHEAFGIKVNKLWREFKDYERFDLSRKLVVVHT